MTKSLLLAIAVAATIPAQAQLADVVRATTVAPAGDAMRITLPHTGNAMRAQSARTVKQSHQDTQTQAAIMAPHKLRHAPAMRTGELPEGTVMYESFELWDGNDLTWLPDGWSTESHTDSELTALEKWSPSGQNPYLALSFDGNYAMAISYASNPQDEWLISPQITLPGNQNLSFLAYIDPVFLFDTNYIDWDTGEISQLVVAATLKVMIKADGGEWTEIWDATTPFASVTNIDELYAATTGDMVEYNIDLSAYQGKNVQLAFRYVGIDGNTMYIDAIKVGYPSLDNVYYYAPFNTLYWGFDRTPGWASLNLPIAQYAAYDPITWANSYAYPDATYSWKYCSPEDASWVESSEQESITVTYHPDYTSDFTKKNNLYYPPILTASQQSASACDYQAPYKYFQIGGTAEISLTDGDWTGGLLPFEHNSEGFTYLTAEADFGELDTPITGYSSTSDQFWYDYTFPGETSTEYASYVDGILNFVYPCSQPLVVDGATVLARGKNIDPEVEMTLSIYSLNDEFIPEMETPMAQKTLKASEFIAYDADMNLLFYTLPFDFDTPVILDNSHPGYVVMLSGFHDNRIEYFAPIQSELPNPDEMCYGYVVKYTKFNSDTFRQSFTPLAYLEGDYGPCYNSFAINLNAHYGWLNIDTEQVDVPATGTSTVAVDTYYPEERVAVSELPGIIAEYTGRYDTGVLTLSRDPQYGDAVDGNITVSVPGYSKTIHISSEAAGVSEAIADTNAEVEGIYTPAGIRVADGTALAPGIYIVRRTDGSVSKIRK